MVPRVFAIAILVTAVSMAAGEDKDPIKEKLFTAKVVRPVKGKGTILK